MPVTDRVGRRRGAVAAALLFAVVDLAGCVREGESPPDAAASPPPVDASIVQYRRDEALRRVGVRVSNLGSEPLHVVRLALSVPGFASAPAVRKDSPILPGLTVNLPIPYGDPRCAAATPRAGRPAVVLRMRVGTRRLHDVRLTPRDPDTVLQRILEQECLSRRLGREVTLTFGPEWRRDGSGAPGSAGVSLRGTVNARLRGLELVREITQLGGTVIFDLRPAGPASPLARLEPRQPYAAVPVVVSVARCDGHARAETKKPYAFLAWVRDPAVPAQEHAVVVHVDDVAKRRLQQVCPL